MMRRLITMNSYAVSTPTERGHALHHAARELLGVGALEAFEADFRDEAARDRGALFGGHAPELEAELEVVLHGEPGKQRVGLEHHAAVLARPGDQLAVQIDGARGRLDQAGDQP